MLVYNQCPHQSFSNNNPFEVHHSSNTLDIFLKQYSNDEGQEKKGNLMLAIQFESIELLIF